MTVVVAGPAHISAARRMSALAESDGSSVFRAVSAPQTGSVAASISPSCARSAFLQRRVCEHSVSERGRIGVARSPTALRTWIDRDF